MFPDRKTEVGGHAHVDAGVLLRPVAELIG
jgi:hypothetical protein